MRKFLTLSVMAMLCTLQVWAQRTITGRVTDDKGTPIPNVSVQVRGTNTGTVTNSDGTYTLTIPANGRTLVFSAVDMATQELNIGNQTTLNATLLTTERNLQEVVVVGYGTQRRRELTGAVDRITAKEIENLPIVGPDQALQGRAAGVVVTQSSGTPGSSINVNIRGVGSLSGGTQPLYIIDGIPVNTGSFSQIAVGGQTLNRLVDLNPNEIESFEILKDASATAIYGARAANGVVLITTKRGRNQKTRINYSTSYGVQNSWRQLETLTGPEYVALVQESIRNRYGATVVPSQIGLVGYDNAPDTYPTTNWQNEVFRQAPIMQHDLSFTGGSERTKFYVGGGYFDQDGIIIGSGFKRYNFRANLDNTVSDKFKISTGLSVSRSITQRSNNDNNIYGVLSAAVLATPQFPVFNANGTYGKDPNSSVESPIAAAREASNDVKNNRILANLAGEYQILPSLSFRTTFGADYLVLNELQFYTSLHNAGAGVRGQANEGYNQSLNLINENILTYKKTFGNHDITALGVASFQQTNFESIFATAENFPGNTLRRLSAGSVKKQATSTESEQGIIGYVGRLNYGYKGKYLFSASVRRDGASNFDADRQWGTFPAVSAAWRISEEKFMDGLDFVSDLKIRASHGTVANLAGIDFYASRALVGVGANYLQAAGLAPSQLGNPALTWEKARQTDVALELGFLNRFNLTIEGYVKRTTDLLQSKPLVATSGFTGVTTNVGELENKGLEFTLNTQNIRKQNFTWTTDFNLTFQKNEIKRIEGGVPFAQGFASWVEEGQSLGSFRGYRVVGIFQSADQIAAAPFQSTATRPGDIQFADLNGDNAITGADQEILGNALPKFFGGLTNNITYRGFELNAFLQFVSGNKIYNNTRAFAEGMNSIFGQFATVRDRWVAGKTDATLPRAVFGDPANNRRTSDRWLEDGSYMRLKNVVLSYGLPSSVISRFKISSLRFFVQGQNLITWTDYSGFDPEVSTFSITNTAPGTDFLTYPQARTITFGLNLGF